MQSPNGLNMIYKILQRLQKIEPYRNQINHSRRISSSCSTSGNRRALLKI
jgi:hypothetical protein